MCVCLSPHLMTLLHYTVLVYSNVLLEERLVIELPKSDRRRMRRRTWGGSEQNPRMVGRSQAQGRRSYCVFDWIVFIALNYFILISHFKKKLHIIFFWQKSTGFPAKGPCPFCFNIFFKYLHIKHFYNNIYLSEWVKLLQSNYLWTFTHL